MRARDRERWLRKLDQLGVANLKAVATLVDALIAEQTATDEDDPEDEEPAPPLPAGGAR